jgi:hypothetical protein
MKTMKQILFLLAISGLLLLSACNMQNGQVEAQTEQKINSKDDSKMDSKNKTPVLVELFTSEGCSSCPPADAVLARLLKEQPNTDAEIITLALHVDYWNRLGWKDEFSDAKYSERQSRYADKFNSEQVYTPQMVVDGQKEFVGSNFGNAKNAVAEAAKNKKASVEIQTENSKVKINIKDLNIEEDSSVYLVVAQDNLATNVKSGENSGKNLRHESVVREFNIVGNVSSADKSFSVETPVEIKSEWNKKDLSFVVFVQGTKSKKIYALSKKSLL